MVLTSWGKSMYGGWYINYMKDGTTHTISGERFKTKKELYEFTLSNKIKLTLPYRFDNI